MVSLRCSPRRLRTWTFAGIGKRIGKGIACRIVVGALATAVACGTAACDRRGRGRIGPDLVVVAEDGFAAGRVTVPAGAFDNAVPAGVPAGGRYVDVTERSGILCVARIDLHDDMVLITGAVDDRYLALPECIVERIIYLLRRDAKTRCSIAIDI